MIWTKSIFLLIMHGLVYIFKKKFKGGEKMSKKIEEKKKIVDGIKKNFEGAVSIVLINARGLKADEETQLRKELREAKIIFKVYKNTMLKFAFDDSEFKNLSEYLSGPTTVAISYDDATSAARIINKFMKENENLEFKAGFISGNFYNGEEVKAIANIPSREELLSKLLGSIKSPMASFARVIKAIADKKVA